MIATQTIKPIQTSGYDWIIERFEETNLESLSNLTLMNRVDTKYLVPLDRLQELLIRLVPRYQILSITGEKVMTYENTYFDTPSDQMYLAHHNGRLRRLKIRIRTYQNSGTHYLEVKQKNNKGRTDKQRIYRPSDRCILSGQDFNFIKESTSIDPCRLEPKLYNRFQRITLIDYYKTERCTIDTALVFQSDGKQIRLDQLAILEIKSDRTNKNSILADLLRQMNLKPSHFSKYCMGRLMLDPRLKANRFKQRLRTIDKIKANYSITTP